MLSIKNQRAHRFKVSNCSMLFIQISGHTALRFQLVPCCLKKTVEKKRTHRSAGTPLLGFNLFFAFGFCTKLSGHTASVFFFSVASCCFQNIEQRCFLFCPSSIFVTSYRLVFSQPFSQQVFSRFFSWWPCCLTPHFGSNYMVAEENAANSSEGSHHFAA